MLIGYKQKKTLPNPTNFRDEPSVGMNRVGKIDFYKSNPPEKSTNETLVNSKGCNLELKNQGEPTLVYSGTATKRENRNIMQAPNAQINIDGNQEITQAVIHRQEVLETVV